ncbi:hypothetical protein LUZ60_012269 [Juncus effusus]|nr:hypothetical protein LUZ60_012269 [Juncus effusus]
MADEAYNRRRSRPTRPNYLPPNLRNNNNSREVDEQFADVSLSGQDPSFPASNAGNGINFDAYDDIPVEVSGSEVPPPVGSFLDIQLGPDLDRNIKRVGYNKPTPVQKYAIPVVLAGRDLMACAQTGSGKTAAFCLPIIAGVLNSRDGFSEVRGSGRSDDGYGRAGSPFALILAPTRELAGQIHDEANKFANRTRLRVVVVYGGVPIFHQLRNLERGVDILVATPGRLNDLIDRERVSLSKVKYLALDEADRMLDMGFERQIRKIVEQTDMPRQRQTMLFSATFPSEIQRLAADFLTNYVFLTVGRVGSSTDLITQKVIDVSNLNKRSHLIDLLRDETMNGSSGKIPLTLVFVETKREADSLESYLSRNGFPATSIHGDRTQWERESALKSFKRGTSPILVATDVAARGLDIPNVSHVINFDLPKNIDSYVHRIGRTGRAGKSGLATAFFDGSNYAIAKSLTDLMKEANQQVPDWLLGFNDGGSYGQSNDYGGGGDFGGYDYRKDEGFNWGVERNDYDYNSNQQSYQDGSGNGFGGGLGFGTEQVVATGWE